MGGWKYQFNVKNTHSYGHQFRQKQCVETVCRTLQVIELIDHGAKLLLLRLLLLQSRVVRNTVWLLPPTLLGRRHLLVASCWLSVKLYFHSRAALFASLFPVVFFFRLSFVFLSFLVAKSLVLACTCLILFARVFIAAGICMAKSPCCCIRNVYLLSRSL